MCVPACVVDGQVLRLKGHVEGTATPAGLAGHQETYWPTFQSVVDAEIIFCCLEAALAVDRGAAQADVEQDRELETS
jgi:hypothetical protein